MSSLRPTFSPFGTRALNAYVLTSLATDRECDMLQLFFPCTPRAVVFQFCHKVSQTRQATHQLLPFPTISHFSPNSFGFLKLTLTTTPTFLPRPISASQVSRHIHLPLDLYLPHTYTTPT